MTPTEALQKAVVAALKADTAVAGEVGVRVYDEPPAQPVYPYIDMGPSVLRPDRRDCLTYVVETLQVDVWCSDGGSKARCKALTAKVVAALNGASLALDDPHALERCDVVLARVIDDPDGLTVHGIVQVEAGISTAV